MNECERKEVGDRVPGGRGVLKKVLYGEAPPRRPTPYPFIYHFSEKAPLSYTFYWKKAPLSLARLMNKSLKQEIFLPFFSRSA